MKASLAAGLMLMAGTAYGQSSPCAQHDVLIKHLADKFHESVRFDGVVTDDGMETGNPVGFIEITASDAGTWTALVTDVSTGVTCIRGSGAAFKVETPKPTGEPM